MAPELWQVLAVTLLGLAAAGSVMALAGRPGPWAAVALGGRLGSLAVLSLALWAAAAQEGGWAPLDLRQMALAVALAAAAAHLAHSRLPGTAGGSPAVDLLVAALVIVEMAVVRPGAPALTCAQRALPYHAEWGLFFLGSGATLVSGGAGLFLALGSRITSRLPDTGASQRNLLGHAAFLSTLALGGGIVAGVWWTWRTTGTLVAGDIRESWMAVTWLLAAMSLVAWQLERQASRWAAVLAIAAAAAALFGLLALPDLQRLMGT